MPLYGEWMVVYGPDSKRDGRALSALLGDPPEVSVTSEATPSSQPTTERKSARRPGSPSMRSAASSRGEAIRSTGLRRRPEDLSRRAVAPLATQVSGAVRRSHCYSSSSRLHVTSIPGPSSAMPRRPRRNQQAPRPARHPAGTRPYRHQADASADRSAGIPAARLRCDPAARHCHTASRLPARTGRTLSTSQDGGLRSQEQP
jgi:hypothetical protein